MSKYQRKLLIICTLNEGGSCVNEIKNITLITRSSHMTTDFKQNVFLFYKLPGKLFQSPSQLL